MDEKELALAINFKAAPKEVQDAVVAHQANVKAIAKAKKKINEAQTELGLAELAFGKTDKDLRTAMKNWKLEG